MKWPSYSLEQRLEESDRSFNGRLQLKCFPYQQIVSQPELFKLQASWLLLHVHNCTYSHLDQGVSGVRMPTESTRFTLQESLLTTFPHPREQSEIRYHRTANFLRGTPKTDHCSLKSNQCLAITHSTIILTLRDTAHKRLLSPRIVRRKWFWNCNN